MRLAAIVDSSYDAIIAKTLDGTITDWNAAAALMFGYSAEEAIGRSIRMLIPEDRAAEELRIISELSSGMRVAPFDTVRRTKDGRMIDVAITLSPIRDSAGKVVGAAKIARDVTLQRRAQAALAESEARLRFTLDAAQIGNWSLDLASGALQRSLWFDRCLGYQTPQPPWQLADFERHLHPEDRASFMQRFHAAIASQQGLRADCRVRWPDGSVHWISVRGTPEGGAQPPRTMMGIVIDITRRKQAEAAREAAVLLEAENRQILEASRAKSLFLANMSHELRTPLNAIIGFADVLGSGVVPADSPRHAVFLGHIQTSGRHLLQLINNVLDLSKVESGKFTFHPERLSLKPLVEEIVDVLHTQILHKRLQVETDIAPELTDLFLDPSRLKQILFNYMANAIKFTPEGGRIKVTGQAQGPAHFRLEVEDTGIGIAPEDMDRLFVEFFQIENASSRQQEGTGLGLAMARRLAEAQGGQVGVRSQLGVGSVFWLTLNRVHGTDLGDKGAGPALADVALPEIVQE